MASVGCVRGVRTPPADAPTACPRFDDGRTTGRVHDSRIDEASGLVAGWRNPAVWWTHNDSGDAARVYALDSLGRTLGVVELGGVEAVDWEDLAIGPGPDGRPWLTIGDVGDNLRDREVVRLLRFPEPAVSTDVADSKSASLRPDRLEIWTVRYEDGAHDAETVLVDPRTGDVWIVTKTFRAPAGLYRVQLDAGGEGEDRPGIARRMGDVDLARATGGDVSPDGSTIVVRSYREALAWSRMEDEGLDRALARPGCVAPLRLEPQGEAVGFSADGRSYSTLSERGGQPLWTFRLLSR